MIPVVLNGVDMTQHAPPHSYIDIKDFKTLKGKFFFLKHSYFENHSRCCKIYDQS